MKIKQGFVKRKIADKWLVVAIGELSRDFNKMIELNETAAMIWDGVASGQSADEIATELAIKYEISVDTAKNSVDRIIAQMSNEGIFE